MHFALPPEPVDPGRYYEQYWSPEGFAPSDRSDEDLRRFLGRYVGPRVRCLDFGCGDGSSVGLWLNKRVRSYVGVDLSLNAVRAATESGLRALQVAENSTLPFPDATFDLVTCVEVFEHMFAPLVAAHEIARVLKPGGVLLATVPNVTFWRRRVELALMGCWNPLGDDKSAAEPWRDPHIRFFTPVSLRAMLSAAGFRDISVAGHGGLSSDDAPVMRIKRRLKTLFPGLLGYRLYAVAYRF